jgi:F-type H+-transporting ATPase subunit delta
MPAAVASRYARALVDVVLGPKSKVDSDRVRQDLRSFEQAMANSLELGNALASPAVKRPRKRSVVTRLAKALELSQVAQNFLLVLVDHRRTSELSDIILAFERIVDERLGRVQADVVSARELKEPQQAALVRQLEAMSGKKVRLNLSVDGDLVGGVIVRLGSTVYDGSVRGQLDSLSRQLRAE